MANAYHSRRKYAQIAAKLRGQKRTMTTRKRISEALMGHKHSPETLAKMRGRKRSRKFRRLMRKLAKGRTPWNKGKTGIYSEETIEKLRQANLGKKTSPEIKKKLRRGMIRFFKKQNPKYVPPRFSDGTLDRKHESARRTRLKLNGGSHTDAQWEALKMAYKNKCPMCKRTEPEIKLTKDHIIALRIGGTDDISNIQPLCRSCNSKKR